MIVGALIEELSKRFQHEKRARVCLWFDEKREFERLLDKVQERLSALPAPFSLLRYDPDRFHGQIWIKDQVRQGTSGSRFVVYAPVSEDRILSPGDDGKDHLELLEEYRIAGITWHINGRQPSLFGLLRTAGVELPENSSGRRELCDGGRNSLLAKYAARFAERSASFWCGTLTAEIARTRLVGDLEKTTLDLAADPDGVWNELESEGLLAEYLEMVRERFGYSLRTASPSNWIRGFVEILALTETFLGYGEPADFPFANRLPPAPLREHHSQFLRRWLRDAEARPVWERLVAEAESRVDVSAWADEKEGFAFGFPHLVAMRWRKTLSGFEQAAGKNSTTDAFFAVHRSAIARETEYAKASPNPIGAWTLLGNLDALLENCRNAMTRVDTANAVQELTTIYVTEASRIDGLQVQIVCEAAQKSLPAISRVATRAYAAYAKELNDKFFPLFIQQEGAISGFDGVTAHLQKELWSRSERRAVVIVDALRLDAAYAVRAELRGFVGEVHPVVAMLPTMTAVGMTALLPLKGAQPSLEWDSTQLRPKLKGKDMSARANRLALLADFGADCRDIDEIERGSEPPDGLGKLLVVSGHQDLDDIGHGNGDALNRHLKIEVDRLAALIRKLHHWGYPEVHVVTDHGFVLLDEEKLPIGVTCEKDWCYLRKDRFALVPATADLPLATVPLTWAKDARLAIPPGLAFFAGEKPYCHGGATLQELVIPHLVSRAQVQDKRIVIEVLVPVTELSRSSVKVILQSKSPGSTAPGQINLFREIGRTLQLDVFREEMKQDRSVLATGPKEISIEQGGAEIPTTLFFRTAESFRKGEVLKLEVMDADTGEMFPTGGIKLTIGRDM